MNLPNQLTVSRFVVTIFMLLALFTEFPFNTTVALALFVGASITDWIDGAYARKHKLVTNFGKLMDPLADKILTCSAFIAFVGEGWIAAWMVVLIVARELAITGLRLLAASKDVVLAAEGWGKHKTIWQITTIIAILVWQSYGDWGAVGNLFGFEIAGRAWIVWFAEFSKWLTILLTAISGWLYLWKNREVFLKDV
ncbi:MAG TPA: CDP-diacylglycerol--glycerol-3-phosphate 3-phosphatidyltransferase [Verrucomicrobiales bacterium]|nr:CDP-diacylglycerol--glycerol-3-phosphate 3-phosphatidyltransferase [Verrucomicrobiales bacterium]